MANLTPEQAAKADEKGAKGRTRGFGWYVHQSIAAVLTFGSFDYVFSLRSYDEWKFPVQAIFVALGGVVIGAAISSEVDNARARRASMLKVGFRYWASRVLGLAVMLFFAAVASFGLYVGFTLFLLLFNGFVHMQMDAASKGHLPDSTWLVLLAMGGAVLFFARLYHRTIYGIFETMVGFALGMQRASDFNIKSDSATKFLVVALSASLYVIVRGLDNVHQGLTKEPKDRLACRAADWLRTKSPGLVQFISWLATPGLSWTAAAPLTAHVPEKASVPAVSPEPPAGA